MKPIEISMIGEDTPLPVNIGTFWASVSNKANLQMFLRKGVIKNAAYVFSCFSAQNMLLPCQSQTEGCLMSLSEFDLTIEEADVWLVPHAIHATQTGAKRLVILSVNTDVMVLALYFNTDLKKTASPSYGCVLVLVILQDISLALISEKKPELCSVLPAIHTCLQAVTQLAKLKPNYLLLNHLPPSCFLK